MYSHVNWLAIEDISMDDFKDKEIECPKRTYGQDGALQENTVQTNIKKPKSYYKMALIIRKANVLSRHLEQPNMEQFFPSFKKQHLPPHCPHKNKSAQ